MDDVVVDIGASNIEDLLTLMRRYQGSHEDFDIFIVPAVPAGKQQRDTIATLVELSRLGIPPGKVRVIFNMVEDDSELERQFEPLLAFLQQSPMARVSLACQLGFNEIYGRLNGLTLTWSLLPPIRPTTKRSSRTAQTTNRGLLMRKAWPRSAWPEACCPSSMLASMH